jgi:MoxR-like ATPase
VDDVRRLRHSIKNVRISTELKRYAVELARATRSAPSVQLGAGPRASLALARMAQALALVRGEEFVTPDHVRDMAVPVLAHRLVLDPQAKFAGATTRQLVENILRAVPVPG